MQLTADQLDFQRQYSFPHCDQRILHEPGVCKYCDNYPQWQALRTAWGIAFTGTEESLSLVNNPQVRVCSRPYPHRCSDPTQPVELRTCNGWSRGWPVLPCPADASRPPGAPNDHRRWGGNKPTSASGDPSWPIETTASRMMYGDKGGREPWGASEYLSVKSILRGAFVNAIRAILRLRTRPRN